jgi:hypothetical protein
VSIAAGAAFTAYALLTVGDGRETNAPQPAVAGAPANITDPVARGVQTIRAGDRRHQAEFGQIRPLERSSQIST